MIHTGIKLHQLLDAIDYNRETTLEKIQVCKPNSDWEEYDEVLASSALLLPLYQAEVTTIQAIEEDVIRIDIDWASLNLYGWAERKEE